MELNILKLIKSALYKIRRATPIKHKPMPVLEKKIAKKSKPTKHKRKVTRVNIEGECLSLKEISAKYNIALPTIQARYRVGNRGKLLIRPSQKQQG